MKNKSIIWSNITIYEIYTANLIFFTVQIVEKNQKVFCNNTVLYDYLKPFQICLPIYHSYKLYKVAKWYIIR